MMRKCRKPMSTASLRLARIVTVLTMGLCGCLGPPNELGILHTPMPTRSETEYRERLFPETLKELLIPRECVKEVPLRIFSLISLDLSPDGEWLVGTGKQAMPLGITPSYFLFFHNLETGESRVLPRNVDNDTYAELQSKGVQWDGAMSGLFYVSAREEGRKLAHLYLSDGRVEKSDCHECVDVDVEESLGLAAYIRVTHDKELQLEVRQWSDDRASPLLTMPIPRGASWLKLSPTGRRVSYQVLSDDAKSASRFYVDLASSTTLKLGENGLNPWVTDAWVLEPDHGSPRVWKYNLETNAREVFVEFAPDALSSDEGGDEKESKPKSVAVWSAMIGGRDRQYLIFVPLYNEVITGRLHVADLRCALQRAGRE